MIQVQQDRHHLRHTRNDGGVVRHGDGVTCRHVIDANGPMAGLMHNVTLELQNGSDIAIASNCNQEKTLEVLMFAPKSTVPVHSPCHYYLNIRSV